MFEFEVIKLTIIEFHPMVTYRGYNKNVHI